MSHSPAEILLRGAKLAAEKIEKPDSPGNEKIQTKKTNDLSRVLTSLQDDMRSLQTQHEELLQAKAKLEEQLRLLKDLDAGTQQYDVLQSAAGFLAGISMEKK